jgi:hypothetical protein
LKTIYQRAYPSNKLETQDEKSSQLQFLRQKFLQGLEPELQHIIRYKKVSSFQELVAITQKYAKRVQLEQNDNEKKVFVNAVSTNQNDSLLIKAIEKQRDSINAIATSLKFGNKPAEPTTFQNPATVNSNFSQQMEQLTESMINLGSLISSSIQKDISRNQQRGGQSNGYNQQNQSSFFNPAPQNNFNKSRPGNRFQQLPSGPPAETFNSSGHSSLIPLPHFTQPNLSQQQLAPPSHYPTSQFHQLPQPSLQTTQHQPSQLSEEPYSSPKFGSERRLCYSCRQRGHEIKDCPGQISM